MRKSRTNCRQRRRVDPRLIAILKNVRRWVARHKTLCDPVSRMVSELDRMIEKSGQGKTWTS